MPDGSSDAVKLAKIELIFMFSMNQVSNVLQIISVVLKLLAVKRSDPEFSAHSVYMHMPFCQCGVE